MNTTQVNSQVEVDLRQEPCPMNLVKFKFYLHEIAGANKTLIVLLEEGSNALKNITEFLNYKEISFEKEEGEEPLCIKLKMQLSKL